MPVDVRVNFSHYDCLGRPFGLEGILSAMQKHGIETAVLVPGLAANTDFRAGSSEILPIVEGNNRLYGYLVVNPNFPEESVRLIRSMLKHPKIVGMALFQGVSTPYPNLDDCREILNACRRFGKPVLAHTPTREAVAAAQQMAQEFTSLKLILSSVGTSAWGRAMASRRLLNVYIETSGSFDAGKIEEASAALGPHRVLFGSDMPFSDPASMLALVKSSDIAPESMEKILAANAMRLFDLESPDAEPADEQPEVDRVSET